MHRVHRKSRPSGYGFLADTLQSGFPDWVYVPMFQLSSTEIFSAGTALVGSLNPRSPPFSIESDNMVNIP